jgi:psiF repeat
MVWTSMAPNMRQSDYYSNREPDKLVEAVRTDHIPHRGQKDMMTKSTVVAAIVFSLAIGGVALAQSPQPAADHPAAAPAAGMDMKAVSKACSDQANAKGLHGKERKKFRAECKHKGGKTE